MFVRDWLLFRAAHSGLRGKAGGRWKKSDAVGFSALFAHCNLLEYISCMLSVVCDGASFGWVGLLSSLACEVVHACLSVSCVIVVGLIDVKFRTGFFSKSLFYFYFILFYFCDFRLCQLLCAFGCLCVGLSVCFHAERRSALCLCLLEYVLEG